MKKIILFIITILLVGVLLISSFFIYNNTKEDKEQENIFDELGNIVEENKEQEQLLNLQELYNENNDLVAWLKIDNTSINYPIMQTKQSPNFYLRKNFYKQYSYWGTPYLSECCNINTSDNLIIYGHHINDTKMFGELEKYKNKEFYNNHKIIKLYTMENLEKYKIYSVFKTVAYTGFQYYNYVDLNSEDEFYTFTNKCKELSFFDEKEEVKYGDKFITLSTCEYSRQNGRLVIVAKKIS